MTKIISLMISFLLFSSTDLLAQEDSTVLSQWQKEYALKSIFQSNVADDIPLISTDSSTLIFTTEPITETEQDNMSNISTLYFKGIVGDIQKRLTFEYEPNEYNLYIPSYSLEITLFSFE